MRGKDLCATFSLSSINSEGKKGFLSTGEVLTARLGAVCFLDLLLAKIKVRCCGLTTRVSGHRERTGGVRSQKHVLREYAQITRPYSSPETLGHTLGLTWQRERQWAVMLAVNQSEEFVFKYSDGCFGT